MEFYISALVVIIVAVAVVMSMLRAAARHKSVWEKRNERRFTVCGGRSAALSVVLTLFAPVFLSLLFVFVQAASGGENLSAGPWYFVIAAGCLIGAVLLTFDYMNHTLSVDGDDLTYTDWLGRERGFSVRDIADVVTGKGRLVLLDVDGDRLAIVDKSMRSSRDLLDYLKGRGLSEHQTLDK